MDLVRQTGVFDPTDFHNNVAIIGVGALGSALALQLAKLGIRSLNLYDSDRVESHNLPNQCLYGPGDVGEIKSEAAARRLIELTGNPHLANGSINLNPAQPAHLRNRLLFPFVFTCVDSMAARDRLYRHHVWGNARTRLYGEARMGVRHGAAYLFNPQNADQCHDYEGELYPDSDVTQERAVCGATLSIGATAMTLACALTWMLIAHSNRQPHPNEVILRCDPWSTTSTRTFVNTLMV